MATNDHVSGNSNDMVEEPATLYGETSILRQQPIGRL